jgi:hypothetical protein
MSDLRTLSLTAVVKNADGTETADGTLNYYDLSPDKLLFAEKNLIVEPLKASWKQHGPRLLLKPKPAMARHVYV